MSNKLLKDLLDQNIVERGSFTLKNGETSDIYVDFRKLISKPELLKGVCRELGEMVDIANPSHKYVIVGVMVGGIPFSMGLSYIYDIPSMIVRNEAKDHGTKKRIEGDISPEYSESRELIIVEDVITTASSVLDTIEILEEEGYRVSKIVTLLDRESGGVERLFSLGYEIKVLFRLSDFKRRIGVVGCRRFTDFSILESKLDSMHADRYISLIVSGGAPGADSLAEKWADQNKIQKLIFPADWNKYGRAAGPIRNKDIVESSDLIIAFWDYKSPGTASTVSIATKAGKPVIVIPI